MKKTNKPTKKELKTANLTAAYYAAVCSARDTEASADDLHKSLELIRDCVKDVCNLENMNTSMIVLYSVGRGSNEGLEIAKEFLKKGEEE